MNYNLVSTIYTIDVLDKIVSSNNLSSNEWDELWRHQNITETFVDKYSDMVTNWSVITLRLNPTDAFIDKYHDKIDWYILSSSKVLSEHIIDRFKDKINWISVCVHQVLSEQFIIENEEVIKWSIISKHQKLSEDLIERYKDKVYWGFIIKHQKLSYEFLEKNLYRFSLYISDISSYKNKEHIIRLIENYKHKYDIDKLSYELRFQK